MAEEGTSIHNIIFVIGSIGFIVIIIYVVGTMLSDTTIPDENQYIEGNADDVTDDILRLVYYCWNNNKNLAGSNVCFNIELDLQGTVTQSDFTASIDSLLIPPTKISLESDLTNTDQNLIIIYQENEIIIRSV